MTAMMLLTANSMHDPEHDNVITDSDLVEDWLHIIDRKVKETGNDMLRSFHANSTELHQHVQRKCAEAGVIANGRDYPSYMLLRT
jgi:hypothetical protein